MKKAPTNNKNGIPNKIGSDLAPDDSQIPSLIAALEAKTAARLKAAKQLQLISKSNPSALYPYFDVFIKLLDSDSSVLLWNATIILSLLVKVDAEKKFDAVYAKYYRHLWDGKLVTAANILASSGRIARCRPDLAAGITAELLKADDIPLPTPECREVARGHVLSSLAEYPDLWKSDPAVRDFVVRCAVSHRPPVRKKAEALLKQIA